MAEVDIKITEDGDFLISNNDLELIDKDDLRTQIAVNRIKSVTNDWYYDNIGADMEEVIGKPCSKETADTGKHKIFNALTYDGYFTSEEIFITYQVNKTNRNIVFNVYIKSLINEPTTLIKVVFDLVQGVNLYY